MRVMNVIHAYQQRRIPGSRSLAERCSGGSSSDSMVVEGEERKSSAEKGRETHCGRRKEQRSGRSMLGFTVPAICDPLYTCE